jgi:hypothetical protein
MGGGLEHSQVVQAERLVLRALSQEKPGGPLRENAKLILRDYAWQEPLHALIFEIVLHHATAAPEALRSRLPALLTRRGFPDVAWEDFFETPGPPEEEVLRLIRQLRDAAQSPRHKPQV